jgi:hypothetical protein
MTDTIKKYLISAGKVFLATFVTTLLASLSSVGTISWTSSFWIPLIAAAISMAFKSILDPQIPINLGGTKKTE